jgi:hypothetical protein
MVMALVPCNAQACCVPTYQVRFLAKQTSLMSDGPHPLAFQELERLSAEGASAPAEETPGRETVSKLAQGKANNQNVCGHMTLTKYQQLTA